MLPALSVKHEFERLSRNYGLQAKERAAAAVRSINRALSATRTEGVRKLREEYSGLKASALRSRIKLWRADRLRMTGSLRFSNKRLRLFNWSVRQTKRGIVGRVPKGVMLIDPVSGAARRLTRVELRSAFIQRGESGAANVWMRKGRSRYPIGVLVTPSLSETLVETRLNEALRRRAGERFSVVFRQEARFRLSKR